MNKHFSTIHFDLDGNVIDPDLEIENAIIRLYGGVYKKKNPVLGATRDFGYTCIIFNVILPFLKITVGLRYMNDCPVNKYIPYYMLVGGILQIMFMLTIVFRKYKFVWPFQIFIGAALVIWFLIATTSTYFEWEPDYYITGWRYCHKVLYVFAVLACLVDVVSIVLIMLFACIATSFEMP